MTVFVTVHSMSFSTHTQICILTALSFRRKKRLLRLLSDFQFIRPPFPSFFFFITAIFSFIANNNANLKYTYISLIEVSVQRSVQLAFRREDKQKRVGGGEGRGLLHYVLCALVTRGDLIFNRYDDMG